MKTRFFLIIQKMTKTIKIPKSHHCESINALAQEYGLWNAFTMQNEI